MTYVCLAAIECPPLPSITNGAISYSTAGSPNYALRTVATYSCNAGFFLNTTVGSEMRTCIDDGDNDAEGIFDMQEPACVRKSTIIVNLLLTTDEVGVCCGKGDNVGINCYFLCEVI